MIVHPGMAIAMLREMSERDLAIVMIVATMQDSENDAIERLRQIEAHTRNWRKTLHGGRQKRECELAEDVITMCPRLASAIRQARDYSSKESPDVAETVEGV